MPQSQLGRYQPQAPYVLADADARRRQTNIRISGVTNSRINIMTGFQMHNTSPVTLPQEAYAPDPYYSYQPLSPVRPAARIGYLLALECGPESDAEGRGGYRVTRVDADNDNRNGGRNGRTGSKGDGSRRTGSKVGGSGMTGSKDGGSGWTGSKDGGKSGGKGGDKDAKDKNSERGGSIKRISRANDNVSDDIDAQAAVTTLFAVLGRAHDYYLGRLEGFEAMLGKAKELVSEEQQDGMWKTYLDKRAGESFGTHNTLINIQLVSLQSLLKEVRFANEFQRARVVSLMSQLETRCDTIFSLFRAAGTKCMDCRKLADELYWARRLADPTGSMNRGLFDNVMVLAPKADGGWQGRGQTGNTWENDDNGGNGNDGINGSNDGAGELIW